MSSVEEVEVSPEVVTTSYGVDALRQLSRVLGEAKAADPMAAVTLVVPNNLAGIVARRHLAASGVAGLWIVTLARLAERLGAPALQPRKPATTPIVSAAWRAALDRGPSVFDPVKRHPATVRALVAAHHELRDVDESALDRVAGASALAREVVRLHREVVASLRDDWYDPVDLLEAATRHGLTADAVAELGRVVLYLPQRLGRAEVGFARALAQPAEPSAAAGMSVIAALTGVRRADREVRESLERLGVRLDEAAPPPRTAHRVLHASDADDEVRCAVREVVATLERVPAHRVAVLYGSAQPYARLLHEHLAASEIAVNGPGTRPVLERSVARGFIDVLRLADADLPRAALFTALSEAPTRTFDGDPVPTSRWERISRSAAVVAGDDWDQRLADYRQQVEADRDAELAGADPFPARLDALKRMIDAIDALRDFALGLRQRLRSGRALTTWPELSAWATALFTDLYGDVRALARMPSEEQYAAVAIESAVRGLAQIGAFEPTADLAGLIDAVTLELESSRPRVGRFGDGVLVAPVSASIGLDVDVLYVVGLAEDGYPGRIAEDALLLEQVRERSGGELVTQRDRLGALHRQLHAALAAAPLVVVSFPRGDLRRSTQRLPSRWLRHTLRELAGDHDLTMADWETARSPAIASSPSYAKSLLNLDLPATEQEWRTQAAALRHPLHDETVDAALALVAARASSILTRYDGNLSGADGLPDFADGRRLVSPTALESYATCPHAYFLQRLLSVRPVEQPEELVTISPLDIGTLIHRAMDEFISELAGSLPGYGEPWSPAQRARLREITSSLAVDFERRGATGHRSLWRAERDRILADLDYMLDDDDERRRRESSRVVRSELAFGFSGGDAVEVPTDVGTVRFRGSADKVDERRDGSLLVVDIKTGSHSRYAPIKKDPLVGGTKLQLPVYAQAARQLLHADRAEAAYWFVRQGKRDWIEVQLSDELSVAFRGAVATLVSSIRSGLFPAKPPEQPDYAWVQCEYCNHDGLGHADARARWEAKRSDPALAGLVGLIDATAAADRAAPVAVR